MGKGFAFWPFFLVLLWSFSEFWIILLWDYPSGTQFCCEFFIKQVKISFIKWPGNFRCKWSVNQKISRKVKWFTSYKYDLICFCFFKKYILNKRKVVLTIKWCWGKTSVIMFFVRKTLSKSVFSKVTVLQSLRLVK